MRKCRTCGVEKELEEFYKSGRKDRPEERHNECKECTKIRVKVNYCPIRTRSNDLRRNYGITIEDYDRMLEDQGGTCMLCPATPESQRHGRLHVDHSHETGEVRGLLCHNCNTALGLLNEDVGRMAAMIAYITK